MARRYQGDDYGCSLASRTPVPGLARGAPKLFSVLSVNNNQCLAFKATSTPTSSCPKTISCISLSPNYLQ